MPRNEDNINWTGNPHGTTTPDREASVDWELLRPFVTFQTRLAPRGIPWETMRRSTNVERRLEPNPVPMSLAEQQRLYAEHLYNYVPGTPRGPLSDQAGLADLEAGLKPRPDFNARLYGLGGVPAPGSAGPLEVPRPLPPPRPRQIEPRRKGK